MVTLRECQIRGYEAMKENGKGIVKMFCGTGKTALFTKYVCDHQLDLSVIVFPRIILMSQYHSDYVTSKHWKLTMPKKYLGICSDDDDGSKKRFTTDPDIIREFLKANDEAPKVVTVTYQSLTTLIDILEEEEITPNLVIYDEAHHTTSDLAQEQISESILSTADETFFFTATPTEDMLCDDETYGEVIYEYSHRQAVEDGVCNEFVISIMLSTEPKRERHIYESIVRSAVDTHNQRALVFHAFAEADKDGRTSVKHFRGQEPILRQAVANITTEKGVDAVTFDKLVCEAVTANTRNKKKILEDFENAADNTLFVLHNCSVIAEGVDTKSANMCVFADPRQSYVTITQNIGRITRVSDDPAHNRPGCVLIPCYVDKAKYEAANGEREKVDAIIREDMGAAGNFNAILNVLSALRQEDPEYFDMCLRYPHLYAPEEVMREFTKRGYHVAKTADSLGGLFDIDGDHQSEHDGKALAQSLGKTIEVHTQSMETPIDVYEGGEERVLVVKEGNEDVIYKLMEKKERSSSDSYNNKVPAPKRPFTMNVHNNPDMKVLWNVVGTVEGRITTAFIECEVVDNEERAVRKALKFKEWIEAHGGRKPSQLLKNTKQKVTATLEEREEHSLAQWFCDMKKSKKSTGKRKLYADVDSILVELLGEQWYENEDKRQKAINKAIAFREWVHAHNGRKPYVVLLDMRKEKKENITQEEQETKQLNTWFNGMKEAKRLRVEDNVTKKCKSILYDEVDNILITLFGAQWYDNTIDKAVKFKQWVIDHGGRKPSQNNKSSIPDKVENDWAIWWSNKKQQRKKNKLQFSNEVDHILIELFGEQWYESIDLEQESLDKAIAFKQWIEKHGRKPQEICQTKEARKQASSEQLEQREMALWFRCQKCAKNGLGKHILYASVEDILITLLGEQWFENKDLEQESLDKAIAFKQWIEKHGRKPQEICQTKEARKQASSEQLEEREMALWFQSMAKTKRQFLEVQSGSRKRTGKERKVWESSEAVLTEMLGITWYETENLEQQAIDKAINFKQWVEKHGGRKPSKLLNKYKNKTDRANASFEEREEHMWASWIGNMKQDKMNNKLNKCINDILTSLFGESWHENTKKDCSSLTNVLEKYKPENESDPSLSETKKKVVRKRTVSPPITTQPYTSSDSTSQTQQPRTLTELQKYHQTFKRMTSVNYVKRVQDNRAEWHEYHKVADEHDQRDPEERRPVNKIAKALLEIVKQGKRAIDLGCGKNTLRTLAPHLKWTSVDAVAADDTVTEADITALPYEDEYFSIAVLSRALWATNKEDVLKEAMRILADGGQLIVCEAFRKWWDAEKNENTLINLIKEAGFTLERTFGATPNDGNEVFQYIVCIKPNIPLITI